MTPCPTCTRLSIFVPALMRVSPTAGRSTVVFAPSSTSFSITTEATCGIFSCDPSLRRTKPYPSPPTTTPFCRMTRSPMVIRSRTETLEWMTQSLPITAPGPMVTFGKITVRSPIDAASPMEVNGPIDTSRPSRTVAATAAIACTPAAGRHAGAKSPTARANAR